LYPIFMKIQILFEMGVIYSGYITLFQEVGIGIQDIDRFKPAKVSSKERLHGF